MAEAAAAIKRSPLDGCADSMDKEAAFEACYVYTEDLELKERLGDRHVAPRVSRLRAPRKQVRAGCGTNLVRMFGRTLQALPNTAVFCFL